MEFKNYTAQEPTGRIIAGGSVRVYARNTSTPVTIYDESGSTLTQPLTTSAKGSFGFAAANGSYDIEVTNGSQISRIENERFFDVDDVKTGADGDLLSGTAGTNGNLVQWNGDGDAVDAGVASSAVATLTGTQTLTNKTINTGNNTVQTESATRVVWFDDAATFLADSTSYSVGTIARTVKEGFAYERVLASGNVTAQKAGSEEWSVASQGGAFNILAFGGDNSGTSDNVSVLNAVIAAAEATAFSELKIVFPAGTYNFTVFDLEGHSYLTFEAQGTVNISGTDDTASDFIFGAAGYNVGTPANTVLTREVRFTGGAWLISPASGQTYKVNGCFEGFTDSTFERLSFSGDTALTASADNRNYSSNDLYMQTYLQYSYDNRFIACTFGTPGSLTGTWRYGIYFGNDNSNANIFLGGRVVGSGSASTNSRGIRAAGSGNQFLLDVSAFWLAVDLGTASGSTFGKYFEACLQIAADGIGAGTNRGNTLTGYYECITNGVCFDLGNGGGSEFLTIEGFVRGEGGGSSRTVVDVSSACYGLDYSNLSVLDIDTFESGTYVGTGGLNAGRKVASSITFPAAPLLSSDPNTLDHYEEGSVTITEANIALSSATAEYTRIGNSVWVSFSIVYPTTSDTNNTTLTFTGIPAPAVGQRNAASFGFQVNPNGHAMTLLSNRTVNILDAATGSNRTNAQCSGDQYYGVFHYKV